MYKLYIDESGKNTLSNIQSFAPHFCVGAVMVNTNSTSGGPDFIRRRGDEIKFKYWGHRAQTVLRGNDIRRWDGDFSIFSRDPARKQEFQADILQYMDSAGFRFIWVGVNKSNWIQANPPIAHAVANGFSLLSYEKKLTQMLFEEMLEIYVSHLRRRNYHGQIIVEASDKRQDEDLLAVYNKLMFNGLLKNGWSNVDIRERLTCISFVTKKNKDPETQIADMGAHFLNIDARDQDAVGYGGVTDFDRQIARIFKNKGYQFRDSTGALINSIKRLA